MRAMIAASLLALLASAQPPEPAVRARVDLGGVFRAADYPRAAMMRGEEGRVAISVAVAADGRVTGCRVTASSGSRALDEGTCRVMTERARYAPARDGAGEAVADEVAEQVGWALPREPTGARARTNLSAYVRTSDYPRESLRQGEDGRVEFELDISPQGRVVDCRVMASNAGRRLNFTTCQIMVARARFVPARDAEGRPAPDTVRSSVTWIIPRY